MKTEKTILLVDDDSAFRKVQQRVLEREGYRVIPAEDGGRALGILECESVDLVLTDLLMPKKEGIEMIREISARWPDLSVVAMSGGGRGGVVSYLEISRAMGVKGTLAKPFSCDELLSEVAHCLNRAGVNLDCP